MKTILVEMISKIRERYPEKDMFSQVLRYDAAVQTLGLLNIDSSSKEGKLFLAKCKKLV